MISIWNRDANKFLFRLFWPRVIRTPLDIFFLLPFFVFNRKEINQSDHDFTWANTHIYNTNEEKYCCHVVSNKIISKSINVSVVNNNTKCSHHNDIKYLFFFLYTHKHNLACIKKNEQFMWIRKETRLVKINACIYCIILCVLLAFFMSSV